MAKTGTQKNMLNKLAERVKASKGKFIERSDFKLVAHENIGKDRFRIIATFSGSLPQFEEVRGWAIGIFDGRFKVLPDTVVTYDTVPYPTVSFVLEGNKVKKLFARAMEEGTLVPVSANSFLDSELGTTWTKESIEGKDFLVRVQPDEFSAELDAILSYIGPRTNKVVASIIKPVIDVGDRVVYVKADGSIGDGHILFENKEGTFRVKDSDTHNVEDIEAPAVLDVTAELDPQEKKKVRDYMAQYLGKDLAKQITE